MEIENLLKKNFPKLLHEIPDPPKSLRIIGKLPEINSESQADNHSSCNPELKYLCVVGSRRYSQYGKEGCEHLIEGLRGYPVVIVSGLALGIDGIAHRAALSAGLKTIAVPGSGLSEKVLYPSAHRELAKEIVESGGALISEFEDNFKATPYSFPQRNRIMAGMSHATFVIEAELKSGTLITSKYATEYNRDVFTVPHSIFSKTGEGPHMLLRLGATPITQSIDIITALGLRPKEELFQTQDYSKCSTDEREIVEILHEPLSRDQIIRLLEKPVYVTQTILATMEIKGLIREEMGEIHLI